MEDQQIIDLVKTTVTAAIAASNAENAKVLKDSLSESLGALTQSFTSQLETLKPKPPDPVKEAETLTLKALKQQLDEERELRVKEASDAKAAREADQKTLFLTKRDKAIGDVVTGVNLRDTAMKLFRDEVADSLKEENNAWFSEANGKTAKLEDRFKEWLSTDVGKYFIPANPAQGSGTVEAPAAATTQTTPAVGSGKNAIGAAIAAQLLARNN
jgi:hypothetical protein